MTVECWGSVVQQFVRIMTKKTAVDPPAAAVAVVGSAGEGLQLHAGSGTQDSRVCRP